MSEPNTAPATGDAAPTIHGVLLLVHETGVLLTGAPGAGKSELALEMVRRGHALVADDAPLLTRGAAARVTGRCAPLLAGLLEVRGLGVLDMTALFGAQAIRPQAPLALVVHLLDAPAPAAAGRLFDARGGYQIQGVTLPRYCIYTQRSVCPATRLEALCLAERQRRQGHDAEQVLHDRLARRLDRDAACV